VAEVHGTCDNRFETVRTALAESLDTDDVGASAAVFVDGEPVADLWRRARRRVPLKRPRKRGTGIRLSDGNSVAGRRAEIPSAAGYGNARSVAAVQAAWASCWPRTKRLKANRRTTGAEGSRGFHAPVRDKS